MCLDAEVHAAVAFLASAALDCRRHPDLAHVQDLGTCVREFLFSVVTAADERTELRPGIEVRSVVDTLHAVLIGMALFADDDGGGDHGDRAGNHVRIDTMMSLLTGDLVKDPSLRTNGPATQVA